MSVMAADPATQSADEAPMNTWQTILWWEYRRIPFNVTLLVIGVVSVFAMEAIAARVIEPGEDAVEPIALMAGVGAYAVAANVFYTLGWVVELIVRRYDPVVARKSARVMFNLGFIGSCVLTTAPIWLAALLFAITAFQRK
jgi:hypothetical protein